MDTRVGVNINRSFEKVSNKTLKSNLHPQYQSKPIEKPFYSLKTIQPEII